MPKILVQKITPRPLLSEKPLAKKFHFDTLYVKMKHIVSSEGFYRCLKRNII